ncbi:hypothetical protein F2981_00750 [Sinorhizobium meliloti]|nr:hypothetical protein [Sinorhizobium meliloti]
MRSPKNAERRRPGRKKTELPLGKETEANLFKSRSIFNLRGPSPRKLAQKVCSQLVALAAASDDDIASSSTRPPAMSNPRQHPRHDQVS